MSKHLHIQIPDNAVRVDIRVTLVDLDPEPLASALRTPLAPAGAWIVPADAVRDRRERPLYSAAQKARIWAMADRFAATREAMSRHYAKRCPAGSRGAATPSAAAADDKAQGEHPATLDDYARRYRRLYHLLQADGTAADRLRAAAMASAGAGGVMGRAGPAGAVGRAGSASKRDTSPGRGRPAAQEVPAAPHPRPHRWSLEAKAAPRTPRLHLQRRSATEPTRKP